MTAGYSSAIQDAVVWVFTRADRVVAVLVAEPRPDHLFIDTIAVAPDEQGSGLGRLLLQQAETAASQMGLDEIRLYTNDAMTENLAFYPRLGFTETGRRTEYGFRRVFFAKSL